MRLLFPVVVLAIALAAEAPATAQPRGEPHLVGGFGRPLFLEHLFRPEVVMRHQGAIELTAEQRTAIAAVIKDAQERLAPLQWELDARSEEVAKLVEADRVDVDKTLAAATVVLETETRIKREHLRMLLRIKNELTAAQQRKLRELRPDKCRGERRAPPLDGGGSAG